MIVTENYITNRPIVIVQIKAKKPKVIVVKKFVRVGEKVILRHRKLNIPNEN